MPQSRDAGDAAMPAVARTWPWQDDCITHRRGLHARCDVAASRLDRDPAVMALRTDVRVIAYLSMEVALESDIPTYAGGLGVLAGDLLRSAADLEIPMVGVTLAHRRGYFRQRLAADGRQRTEPKIWAPEARLAEVDGRCEVEIEGRRVVERDIFGSVADAVLRAAPIPILVLRPRRDVVQVPAGHAQPVTTAKR